MVGAGLAPWLRRLAAASLGVSFPTSEHGDMSPVTSSRSILTEPFFFLSLGVVLLGGLLSVALFPGARAAVLIAGSGGVAGALLLAAAFGSRIRRIESAISRLATEEERRDVEDTFQLLERLRQRLLGTGRVAAEDRARRQELLQVLGAQLSEARQAVVKQREQLRAASKAVSEMNVNLQTVAENVETLAGNAEESSSAILELAAAKDEVAENMYNLGQSVEETASSIEQMTISIKEVAHNVDSLATTAEETSAAMNEIDISIRQVKRFANESAGLSEAVSKSAGTGVEAINQVLSSIAQIKDTSGQVVDVIGRLGSKIGEIGKILNVIDEVSDQTNLLALNAAIIAAQAGEHGRGFAVVADEIKDLAERSAASTKEIAALIEGVQAESSNAIRAVQEGARSVDQGVKVSHAAESALRVILESAERATEMVKEIAQTTVEQATGTNRVADAISSIAERVQQMASATAEQARGSEQIMRSADRMRTITQQVERSTQEQTRGSRLITRSIEGITEMVNQINRVQGEQARRGLELNGRVEEVASLAETHEAQLAGLAKALDAGRIEPTGS